MRGARENSSSRKWEYEHRKALDAAIVIQEAELR
jgi:hypothetical protein